MTTPRAVDPATARAAIAQLMLRQIDESPQLGRIGLKPHQISAVARLRSAIGEFGGALLCDPVGTGKTYVALACIPTGATALLVAPAVLREMWLEAASLSEREVSFASFESLSRQREPPAPFDFLIVDEAHHVRNPVTTRYRVLSRLATGADVLLLTATPVHNHRNDLASLIALFAGEDARSLTMAELCRCVIRRTEIAAAARIPHAEPLVWCRLPEDPGIPVALLALPPPLPPRDGGDGGSLVIHSLVRQWASSDAALIGALRRRLLRSEGLISALENGEWPSHAELSSWILGDDAIQLSFPSMLAEPTGDAAALLPVVVSHRDSLRVILEACRDRPADIERVKLIRQLRRTHRDRPVVVFSQYADTVHGLFDFLRDDGQVAVLSGAGGRVAGGPIAREELIRRFAPAACRALPAHRGEAVTLLLATDLLSEGVNLQDAGVVVHLDLPWTPAKMEQRLGRIARMGSPHEAVASYAIRPPVASQDLVRIERILSRKMKEAGIVADRCPSLAGISPEGTSPTSAPSLAESVRSLLFTWKSGSAIVCDGQPIVSVVKASRDGFVAVCRRGGQFILVAGADGSIKDDPDAVLAAMQNANGPGSGIVEADIARSLDALKSWLISSDAIRDVRAYAPRRTSFRRMALRRVERAVRRARPHERARLAQLSALARTRLLGRLNRYEETEILRASGDEVSDLLFLQTFASDWTARRRGDDSEPRVEVLIEFRKTNALSPAKES